MTEKTIERYRDEYMGAVMGAAALAFVATAEAFDAMDAIQERCPQSFCGAVRRHFGDITGRGVRAGSARRVRIAIEEALAKKGGMAWVDDFGNAVHAEIGTDLMRLRFAIANELGKHKAVPDFNACASLLLAQSLANEQSLYVERRACDLRGFSVKFRRDSPRERVSDVLRRMSCWRMERSLTQIARLMLGHALPEGTDLASVRTINDGCRAVLNRLADTRMWERARDKADEYNGK